MATTPLRIYLHDIEGLVGAGQMDEAIAHCRHILQTFPKSIAVYRLLGKAYLENQRYGDAADVFQRVLSAVPDDFVSHVGMSIIREDEATWTPPSGTWNALLKHNPIILLFRRSFAAYTGTVMGWRLQKCG